MSPTSRPDRTTMPGMMWNTNYILGKAIDPKTVGIPKKLFEHRDLKGIVIISVVEAGFIWSGSIGTGLLIARRNGKWSAPSAIGLAGVGWGFIAGASHKELFYFIFDDQTLQAIAGDVGFKLGGQVEITLGPFGRSAEVDLNISNKGIGASIAAVSFNSGLFAGVSVEGASLSPRSAVNEMYYSSTATPSQIIFEDAVQVPEGTLMPQIYEKLDKLLEGEIHEPTPEELAQVDEAFEVAQVAGEEARQNDSVVEVDSKVEGGKDAAKTNDP
jgi:lipid-binding SYLF domain-containing protein